MKKELTYEQALKVLQRGQQVECQQNNRKDDTEIVHNKARLQYLYNLSKDETQKCIIYKIPQKSKKVPENSIEISFDEAYTMVSSGELIYYENDEGEEEEIIGIPALISIRRKAQYQGRNLLLYWYE